MPNKINPGLLSMRALTIFSVAARHANFSKAAEELFITPASVSKGIAQLEEILGTELFQRHRYGVELTPKGKEFAYHVSLGLSHLNNAFVEVLPASNQKRVVNLLATTCMATYWLLPRLSQLRAAFPDAELVINTCPDYHLEHYLESSDLCLGLSTELKMPDLDYRLFNHERFIPVCSPAFKTANPGMTSAADLADRPLIDLQIGNMKTDKISTWSYWLQHQDVALENPLQTYLFNEYSIAVQSAINGEGIVFGWVHIIYDLLESQRLVPAIDTFTDTGRPYYIVSKKADSENPLLLGAIDWLVGEAQDSLWPV